MSFFTVVPGSFMATGIFNLESSRFMAAPRDTRSEGWTESWGAEEKDLSDPTRWNHDNDSIALLLATPHPQLPLVLTQFRPAWLEQLVLRMAGIPHIVLNSAHGCNEATGPLPYLRDCPEEDSLPAILVGRAQPSNIAPAKPLCQNSILECLKTNRKVDLDGSLATDQQLSLSKCFLHLIQSELQPILLYLRFEDFDAWEQVYRQHYLNASSPRSNHWISQLYGRFQACLERVTARHHMVEYSRTMTIPQAVARAKEAYQALELQLSKHGKPFLLGNDKPSLVDGVLWAHLAEALCDVHLVSVLADFPTLVKYFQRTYKTYFTGKLGTWDEWNQQQNMANCFQQELPILNDKKKMEASGFKDAIELMQSLSLRNQDLQDVLETAKANRSTEPWPTPAPATDSLLYRWRMGEDVSQKRQEEAATGEQDNNPMRNKLIRDQVRNDQTWLSGVAGVSAVAILLLQGASSKSS